MKFLLNTCLLATIIITASAKLKVVHEWKYIDYVWDSEVQKRNAIQVGDYVEGASALYDVDRASDGRLFVTSVRGKGVAASLMTVTEEMGNGGPLLKPYPSWSWASTNCSGITNVYRVTIDKCNRLWVLDCGQIDGEQVCPPQVLVFDLASDTLVKRIELDAKLLRNAAGIMLLVNIVLEVRDRYCQDVTAYMADVEGYGMIIWEAGKVWRVENPAFFPDPAASTFTIAGQSFSLSDGLLGMAISNPMGRWHSLPTMFLTDLASFDVYSVPTAQLRQCNNESITIENVGALPSQTAAIAFSNGVLFFSLIEKTAIACWNTNYPLTTDSIGIIEQNEETLQFASGMKVVNTYRNKKLYVMTNRLQKIATETQKTDEVNFRILSGCARNLIRNTVCGMTSY